MKSLHKKSKKGLKYVTKPTDENRHDIINNKSISILDQAPLGNSGASCNRIMLTNDMNYEYTPKSDFSYIDLRGHPQNPLIKAHKGFKPIVTQLVKHKSSGTIGGRVDRDIISNNIDLNEKQLPQNSNLISNKKNKSIFANSALVRLDGPVAEDSSSKDKKDQSQATDYQYINDRDIEYKITANLQPSVKEFEERNDSIDKNQKMHLKLMSDAKSDLHISRSQHTKNSITPMPKIAKIMTVPVKDNLMYKLNNKVGKTLPDLINNNLGFIKNGDLTEKNNLFSGKRILTADHSKAVLHNN